MRWRLFCACERAPANTGCVSLSILHNKSHSPEREVNDVKPLLFIVHIHCEGFTMILPRQGHVRVQNHNLCRQGKFDQIWAAEVPTLTNRTCHALRNQVPPACCVFSPPARTPANTGCILKRQRQLSAVEKQKVSYFFFYNEKKSISYYFTAFASHSKKRYSHNCVCSNSVVLE